MTRGLSLARPGRRKGDSRGQIDGVVTTKPELFGRKRTRLQLKIGGMMNDHQDEPSQRDTVVKVSVGPAIVPLMAHY